MLKRIDLIGQRFGRLIVTENLAEKRYNEEAWACKCDCGKETIATRSQLTGGRKKSCGCLRKETPPNALDLVGQKFGKLMVIERAGKTKNDNALWLCRCECGNIVKANATTLRRGELTTCGCETATRILNARNVLMNEKSIDGVQIPLLTKKVRSDSATGHKGIYKRSRKGNEYYEANITVKGKRKYAGPFKDLSDAIAARKWLEIKYHQPYIKALEDNEND